MDESTKENIFIALFLLFVVVCAIFMVWVVYSIGYNDGVRDMMDTVTNILDTLESAK